MTVPQNMQNDQSNDGNAAGGVRRRGTGNDVLPSTLGGPGGRAGGPGDRDLGEVRRPAGRCVPPGDRSFNSSFYFDATVIQ